MATERQLKAAILVRRAAKGPRKKRMRPEPRQYTVADLERARDRVRRPSAESTTTAEAIPKGDARGWSGRSANCPSSSRNYACAASLSDGIELWRPPGEHVEGPRSRLCHSPDFVFDASAVERKTHVRTAVRLQPGTPAGRRSKKEKQKLFNSLDTVIRDV
jgi:hypothetical protein